MFVELEGTFQHHKSFAGTKQHVQDTGAHVALEGKTDPAVHARCSTQVAVIMRFGGIDFESSRGETWYWNL